MRSQGYNQDRQRPAQQRSVEQLQQQLRVLKQKEKVYLKLTRKVRELQQKSKSIVRASDQIATDNLQNQQIQKLKADIDKTISDTKGIDEDNKVIKGQINNLQAQLRTLEQAYEGLCGQSKIKRQRIQLLDERLSEKEGELDSLVERKNCNQLVVEELRIEISKLQGEEEEVRRELQRLRMQRQEEERQRDRLKDGVEQLKREIEEQEVNCRGYRYKLSQVREGNRVIKEELIALINLEEQLQAELQKAVEGYQNSAALQAQAKNRLRLMQDELKVAEQDLELLTDEYIKESEVLKSQEQMNQKLNNEIDMTAKEIFEVWESVKELMGLESEENSEMKIKAYKVWMQICQILDIK